MTEIVRTSLQLTLPWPPSVNSYWQPFVLPLTAEQRMQEHPRANVVMALTKRAKLYRQDVAAELYSTIGWQRAAMFTTPVRLEMTLRAPDARKRDIDNHAKGVLDALQHCKILADDVLVDQLAIDRGRQIRGGSCEVIITALDRPPVLIEDTAQQEA